MYELFEVITAWVQDRGLGNVACFLAFVVLPFLAALTIIGSRLIY